VFVIWECQTTDRARLEALLRAIEGQAQEIVPAALAAC